MDHVKTFFKTLLWTLIGIVVVVGGFWAYLRLLNPDLGAKVANLIYKTEVVDCPVCGECKKCEVCPEPKTCEVSEKPDLTDQYDAMDVVDEKDNVVNGKLDEILNILESWNSKKVIDKKKDPETLEEALKRIEELENDKK